MKEKEKKETSFSKSFLIFISIFSFIMFVIVTVTFIVFSNRKNKVIEQTLKGGELVLNYSSNVNGLSIKNATQTTDTVGMKDLTDGKYFDFSVDVSVKDANEIEYEVSVIKDSTNSNISDEDIKIYLEKENSGTYSKVFDPKSFKGISKKTKLGSNKGSMILYKAKRQKSTVDNYRLKMWLSDKSVSQTGNYAVEIQLNGKAK